MPDANPMITTLSEVESFSPPHHQGTTSIELANPKLGSDRAVFRISTMEPGAKDEWHVHDGSDQLMFVRRGTAVLRLDEEGNGNEEHATSYDLRPDMFTFIPEGTYHQVTATGDEPYEVILVWVPPYESFEEWTRDGV